MSRVTVYLPDRLRDRVRAELPGIVLSRVLAEALTERLKCSHRELECRACGAQVRQLELADEILSRFYGDLWDGIGELARKAGTAEGAVKVLRDLGERFGISGVAKYPLVRPSRKARQAMLDAKLAELHDGERPRRRRSA